MSVSTEKSSENLTKKRSKFSTSHNYYHMESIFLRPLRKALKYVSSQESIDPKEQIFVIDQCLKCISSNDHLINSSSSDHELFIPLVGSQQSIQSQPARNMFKFPELNQIITLPIEFNRVSELCFSENLLFSCKTDETIRSFSIKSNELLNINNLKTIGGFSINMETNNEINEIQIFIASMFSCKDNKVYTLSIVAKSDHNFKTIEEKRVEGFYDPNTGEKRVRFTL